MKKAPLYSRSRQRPGLQAPPRGAVQEQEPPMATLSPTEAPASTGTPPPPARRSRWSRLFARRTWALSLAAVFLLMAGALAQRALVEQAPPLTAQQIDAVVRQSLEKKPMPSAYAKAFAMVQPSVVRVIGLSDETDELPKPGDDPREHARSTGTGVVIIENGTILTNLHVVVGAKRIKVTFADGHESDAAMVGAQPENDLAVLRAKSLPDDLMPATMRGTGDLFPGDQVIAVGFPFGIGPSVSGGVVSGLKRQFRSPDGERLTNLIQFDAAANPGNSGGPLVTMDGAVVGIVTAILNPGDQGTFIGIGFAVPIENAAAAAGLPPF
jgi:S1-C subfamily serine protease